MTIKDSAVTKHTTRAGDSTQTRRRSSTQPKPETRQRIDRTPAHKPSHRLCGDSAKNLGTLIPSCWISISSRTSYLSTRPETFAPVLYRFQKKKKMCWIGKQIFRGFRDIRALKSLDMKDFALIYPVFFKIRLSEIFR
jgi:hypothetical protein